MTLHDPTWAGFIPGREMTLHELDSPPGTLHDPIRAGFTPGGEMTELDSPPGGENDPTRPYTGWTLALTMSKNVLGGTRGFSFRLGICSLFLFLLWIDSEIDIYLDVLGPW
jgi:hypothetical protein